ncbi:hypothetical protein KQ933_07240 [Rhizobium sp. WYJ-E13]|nr:hypothetical protein KQ933_07240 [Rhizobium sp. WYJ-E13]
MQVSSSSVAPLEDPRQKNARHENACRNKNRVAWRADIERPIGEEQKGDEEIVPAQMTLVRGELSFAPCRQTKGVRNGRPLRR